MKREGWIAEIAVGVNNKIGDIAGIGNPNTYRGGAETRRKPECLLLINADDTD